MVGEDPYVDLGTCVVPVKPGDLGPAERTTDAPRLDDQAVLERRLESDTLVGLARHVHKIRLLGNEIFGERVLCDPEFDMLLELFVAHHEQRRVCIGDLCLSAGVPATTALRHIDKLEAKGFLRRPPDPSDARRWWAEATEKAIGCTATFMAAYRKDHPVVHPPERPTTA